MIIGHGGNKEALARDLGCDVNEITDMSCNLNPLGPPERVKTVIRENLDAIHSLPEPDAAAICAGFAAYHALDPARVCAGNGTTWFLYTLPHALGAKNVLILGPTYSDYRDGCRMHHIGHTHQISTPEAQFAPDLDTLAQGAKSADLVYICNPNNPTGALVEKEAILDLVKACPETDFVIDESYLPFVERANDISLVSETRFDNLMVLSSMSKIFRIPGLRTGFLSGAPDRIAKVMDQYQPWSVNALAQVVIRDIFDHPESIEPFYEESRAYTAAEKAWFEKELAHVAGIELVPGHTYFILARLTSGMKAPEFCRAVGRAKLLIRDCTNFEGLTDEFVRFSLKDRETNARLVGAVKEALGR